MVPFSLKGGPNLVPNSAQQDTTTRKKPSNYDEKGFFACAQKARRVRDSNPGARCRAYGFQDRRFRPLSQLSESRPGWTLRGRHPGALAKIGGAHDSLVCTPTEPCGAYIPDALHAASPRSAVRCSSRARAIAGSVYARCCQRSDANEVAFPTRDGVCNRRTLCVANLNATGRSRPPNELRGARLKEAELVRRRTE